jgi:urease accessory protein
MAHSHSHDGGHDHSHAAADHGHTHEILNGPGSYMGREMPLIEGRDWYAALYLLSRDVSY